MQASYHKSTRLYGLALIIAALISWIAAAVITYFNAWHNALVYQIVGVIALAGFLLLASVRALARLFPNRVGKILQKEVIRPSWERNADKLIDAERFEEASKLLEPLTHHSNPKVRLKSLLKLGTVLYLQKHWQKCEQVFTQLIDACGARVPRYLYIIRGLCRFHLGKREQAVSDYQTATAVKSIPYTNLTSADNLELGDSTLSIRASLAMLLQLWSEARDDYELLLEAQPGNDTALRQLALIYAAAPDDAVRDGMKSLEYAQQLAEDEWSKFSLIAAAYAECGDFEKAIAWAEKSLEAAPESEKATRLKRLEQYQRHEPCRLEQDEDN